jgi:hypothetical protein
MSSQYFNVYLKNVMETSENILNKPLSDLPEDPKGIVIPKS